MNKYRVKITDSKSHTFEKVYEIPSNYPISSPTDFLPIESFLFNNEEFLQDIIDSNIDQLDDDLKWEINLETPIDIPEEYDLSYELSHIQMGKLDIESIKLSIMACFDEIGFRYDPKEPMSADLKEKLISYLQDYL